ncbi:NAD(P)/FAD-dependent oxidoreductase [Microlunatus ginsengisoli]|uniref:FAD-binding oxidoreductase n=1 Tax=Microlunatus ginsengisoli TaxID=363863 RepID=A0ABP7AI97_9ACTN
MRGRRPGDASHQLQHVVALTTPSDPLPSAVEVAVIGGGIIGVSIAYHLAAAGVAGVLVIERNSLGSGSSAKPLGGVRATFSDPGNIRLGLRSLGAFEDFCTTCGAEIGLHQVGYLFLCRSASELAAVEASVRLQNELGCDSRMISPDEAYELNPFLDPSRLLGASFSPRDGYAEPALVVAGYAAAASRYGARFAEHTEVFELGTGADGVHRILTRRGELRANAVVIAAGAWSTRLGAMLGLHLPIEPVRRQIGFTPQRPEPHPTVPFTLDLSTTLYFHNYRNGLLLGISDAEEEPGLCREFSYGWTRAFDAAAEVVAPALAHQPLVGGWAGLYENSPDHNAMIGRADVPGVFYATGFSGHGFLQGPAVGEIVRDLYLGREPFMDPTPFSADRFAAHGTRLDEVHII